MKWNIQIDPICVLCKNANETRDHLLMEYSYTESLWKRLFCWIDHTQPLYTTWDTMYTWIKLKSQRQESRGTSVEVSVF